MLTEIIQQYDLTYKCACCVQFLLMLLHSIHEASLCFFMPSTNQIYVYSFRPQREFVFILSIHKASLFLPSVKQGYIYSYHPQKQVYVYYHCPQSKFMFILTTHKTSLFILLYAGEVPDNTHVPDQPVWPHSKFPARLGQDLNIL